MFRGGKLAAAVEVAVRDVTYELQRRRTFFKWPKKIYDEKVPKIEQTYFQLLPIMAPLLEHSQVLPLCLCIRCRHQASIDDNEQHIA